LLLWSFHFWTPGIRLAVLATKAISQKEYP
jgi:hypothetical protein